MRREQPISGVLTSPNYPQRYLHNLDLVQLIQVPEGNTIRIRFTDYEVEPEYDTVTVSDKYGGTLGVFDGLAKSDNDWQKEIVSKTNKVEVRFRTDGSGRGKGWRLDWGECRVILISSILLQCFNRNGWR